MIFSSPTKIAYLRVQFLIGSFLIGLGGRTNNSNHNEAEDRTVDSRNTPPQTNKKASNKKLDSQISYFSRRFRDLITKSNQKSLLKNRKSRLS